jgi:hypothetical protein
MLGSLETRNLESLPMSAGIWNIVIGCLMLGLGLSGKMVLMFTGSSNALAVLGAVVAAWGVYQLIRSRQS